MAVSRSYMGKILMVDLTLGSVREEKIDDKIYETYLSGMGLGAWVLYNRIPQGADPLGPDNIIGFLSGLLTGTGAFFSGRWMVVGKSPLTGGWGEANCGGNFSPAIKRCGYDGIFFVGKSETPVYLYVDNQIRELRDASHIWGKDTIESEMILIAEADKPRAKAACIGTAGEKLSLISGISTDKGRMAARSGLGAVMGAKKLKGLVLAGTHRILPHNREEIKRIDRQVNKWIQFQPPFIPGYLTAFLGMAMRLMPIVITQDGFLYKMFLKKWGTVSMNQISVEMGDAPVKNWKGSSRDWGFFKSLSSNPDIFTKCEKTKFHCYSCPLGCGGICLVSGKYSKTHKPEYETVLSLGGLLMNRDVDTIFQLNEILNRAGMDTISAGSVVAFAMECFEKGVLTIKDTGGIELKWGNSHAIVRLIEMMINREGIGDLLADGVRLAAQRIGNNSENFAIHAGGQEPGMHDPRNDPGFALHYSVDPAPGRHTSGAGLYYEMYHLWKVVKGIPKPYPFYLKSSKYKLSKKNAEIGVINSKFINIVNGAGLCMFGTFLGVHRIRIFDWLNAATGWRKTPEDYLEIGSNVQSVKQCFNIKHGIDPVRNKISDRALGIPPQKQGANKFRQVDVITMMKDYWELFGWDRETGKPSLQIMDFHRQNPL